MFAATLAFITSYNWPKKCQVIQITESCPWCCVRRGRSHNHETVPSTAGLKRPLPKYLACHIQRWDGDEEVANGYSHFLMGLFYLCPTENRKKQTHCIDHNHGHIGAPWAHRGTMGQGQTSKQDKGVTETETTWHHASCCGVSHTRGMRL